MKRYSLLKKIFVFGVALFVLSACMSLPTIPRKVKVPEMNGVVVQGWKRVPVEGAYVFLHLSQEWSYPVQFGLMSYPRSAFYESKRVWTQTNERGEFHFDAMSVEMDGKGEIRFRFRVEHPDHPTSYFGQDRSYFGNDPVFTVNEFILHDE